MLPSKIQSALSYCEGKNVYEIMEDNNIELLSIPLESAYGVILINDDKSIIIIDKALPWQCKEFVLWHEIGHFLLDHKNGEFHFLKNSKGERDINVFACLMHGGNMREWTYKGVPIEIAVNVYDYLSQNVYVKELLSDVYFLKR